MIASRRYSIYTSSGRIFLLATADAYGYTLDANGKIVDDDGEALPEDHPDYISIIRKAQEQAEVESHIGSDMDG